MRSEAVYYEILNVLVMIFEGWCAQRIFRAFVEPRMRFRAAKYAVGFFWAFTNTVCSFALENGTYQFVLLMKYAIYIFGLALFSVLWYKGSVLEKLFPVLLFGVIRELCIQATNCLTILNSLLIDLLWWIADDMGLIPIEVFPTLVFSAINVTVTVIELIRVLMIYLSANSIVKSYRYKPEFGKEAVLNLLPPTVALIVSAMLRLMLITIEDGYTIVIYERYPLLYVIIPIMAVGLLAAVIYSFKLYQDMTGLRREQADRAVLENQLVGMQNALAEKERLYDNLNAVRHDMKNSLSALRGLIARKCPDDGEINRYFESMSLSFGKAESRVHTGIAVCDAIISDKFAAAERELPDIRLDADSFFFTDGTRADPYDIGVILSNGLDNALDACKKLKEKSPSAEAYIIVRSFKRKNMFFTEIENSFDGEIKIDEKSGLPLTRKNDRSLHGIGLRNVKACAEKYEGSMDFILRDRVFILSVMLKG